MLKGDSGINGRSGMPGRKGEQVWPLPGVEKPALCYLLSFSVRSHKTWFSQACCLCFQGGPWTFWPSRGPRQRGNSGPQGLSCTIIFLFIYHIKIIVRRLYTAIHQTEINRRSSAGGDSGYVLVMEMILSQGEGLQRVDSQRSMFRNPNFL